MISTVDIILKKLAKNRKKQKSKYGYESDSEDESRKDSVGSEKPEIPTPVARSSKRQPAAKESDSDDSVSRRTGQQVIQKDKGQRRSSIDSIQSQEWREKRQQVKNKSNRSYGGTNRKKKTKNVRTSTRSNKSKSSSTKKGSKHVEDVQSDDDARGREPIDTLSKRFKSVDMLHAAKDFDLESRSESNSSLGFQKEGRTKKNNQPSKSDSDSDSSSRKREAERKEAERREEERKIKHKQLYLELRQRQEQERKEQLLLLEQKKRAEYERYRAESGGSLSPDSKRIVQALRLGDTQAPPNSDANVHRDGASYYKPEPRVAQAPNSKGWSETDDDRQTPAVSVKHMILENNPTGARSKHHVTTQAVIEHSIRQSERRHAGPSVPNKPNKKKNIEQETHAFTTLPPVSVGNFQRGYRNGTHNQGPSVPPDVRGSYKPQQQQPPGQDAYRPSTISHSRRHDYNKPPSSVSYENQQWHQEPYESRGYEQSHPYIEHRLNQEIHPENQQYHPHEYEKYTPTYNAGSLPRDTHHTTHNRLVSDEVPFDPRYQSADLV